MSQPDNGYNVTKAERGDSLDYALKKLEPVRPDLFEKVVKGELSAHAAMLEAGLRKKSFTMPHDARRAAQILCERFGPKDLQIIEGAQTQLWPCFFDFPTALCRASCLGSESK